MSANEPPAAESDENTSERPAREPTRRSSSRRGRRRRARGDEPAERAAQARPARAPAQRLNPQPTATPKRAAEPKPTAEPKHVVAPKLGALGEDAIPSGALTHWKGFELNPFQVRAVEAIRGGHNVLVSAPTGAGKTLVAEYAIEDAVKRGKRCIYTAPIKALSNQKYRDFRDDPQIDVGLMTGDVTIHANARVLIMTTEILRNSIFDNPEHLAEVEYVIFDEVHYMDDFERGSVWEESLIFAPPQIRFVCLSATISNVEELGAWLREIRGPDMVVIRSSKRPVPLEHHLFTARSGVFDPHDIDRVRKHEIERAGRGRAGRKSARVRRGEGDERRRGGARELTEVPNPAQLFDDLTERGLLPALVFAFSRKDCERLALANAGRELLSAEERRRMDALQLELVRIFQLPESELDGPLFEMTRRGIGYHHAGMLPIQKEVVERMFTSGLLKLLFTTETFALGINMPARSVVFYSLRKFDGVTFDYLTTRDYMQMAGRAGRQGLDREGLVFSLLSPKDLVEAPIKRLIGGQPEPVQSRFRLSFSSLLHLVERLGRARVHEAWEKSFNQFQFLSQSEKRREQNRREQRRVLDAHLAFLDELSYLDGDHLTPRGRIAQLINGYEIQITELLFRGVLENLSTAALAVVFVGLVYEERRRGEVTHVPARYHGNVRAQATREIHALRIRAADFQLVSAIKPPDWGLSAAVVHWVEGASFEEVEELTDATPGDIVRNFRMAVQLMRQVRHAIDREWDLFDRLAESMEAIHRDVVDARRQLELG